MHDILLEPLEHRLPRDEHAPLEIHQDHAGDGARVCDVRDTGPIILLRVPDEQLPSCTVGAAIQALFK